MAALRIRLSKPQGWAAGGAVVVVRPDTALHGEYVDAQSFDAAVKALDDAQAGLVSAANQFAAMRASQEAGHFPKVHGNPEKFGEKAAAAGRALADLGIKASDQGGQRWTTDTETSSASTGGTTGVADRPSGAGGVCPGQDEMRAVLEAGRRVRRDSGRRVFGWLRGAPTHVLAELLNELHADGWHLTQTSPSPAGEDAVALTDGGPGQGEDSAPESDKTAAGTGGGCEGSGATASATGRGR